MSAPGRLSDLWVVGPGRLGLALGWQLLRSGSVGKLTLVGRRPGHPRHPLFDGEPTVAYGSDLASISTPPTAILICVPDSAVVALASRLASLSIPPVPVLHTSGVLGSEVLADLAAAGHPTGSLHPLVALADPIGGAAALLGAWFGVEGDPAASRFARELVSALDGRILEVAPGRKPLYHAAAVFASNYVVAMLSVAERLMEEAGLEENQAREALVALAGGAANNVALQGAVAALTGPISRGDAATVELHLDRLSPSDRELYSVVAAETIRLALQRGLAPEAAERIARTLHQGRP